MASKKDEAVKKAETKEQEVKAEVAQAVEEKPAQAAAKSKKDSGTTTKAGKHSAKAQREAEELEEKAARKEAEPQTRAVVKAKQKPRVKKLTKNQKTALEQIDKAKLYSLDEAATLLPKLSKAKFDASAELHFALGIDPRQADQQFRSSVVLPAGTGKPVRVAVLADTKLSKAAADAGADVVDSEQILADIAKGKFNFDILVATPDQMAVLGRHAKVLGPKGLMPSPKSGTVTADPVKAVSEIKKGRLDLKNDANGIVHVAFGKVSFKPADLLANAKAVASAVVHNRPSGVKGTYIKSTYMSATMSPSIKLDVNSLGADSKK